MGATVTWRKCRVFYNNVDLFGNVDEGSVEIKRKFADLKGIGMPADAKLPTGKFEPIVAKLKFNNISPDILRQVWTNDGYCDFRMVGQCRVIHASSGSVNENRLVTIVRGYAENLPVPGVKEDATADIEVTINALFLQVKDDGGNILLIDLPNGLVEPSELG
jgi:Phage tail tube protein FII.